MIVLISIIRTLDQHLQLFSSAHQTVVKGGEMPETSNHHRHHRHNRRHRQLPPAGDLVPDHPFNQTGPMIQADGADKLSSASEKQAGVLLGKRKS